MGGEIRFYSPVKSIEKQESGGWNIKTEKEETIILMLLLMPPVPGQGRLLRWLARMFR